MTTRDSFDKIVTYFAAMTSQQFSYKGKAYYPKPLVVSPLILRHFICHQKCGACCPRFSLDYIPAEVRPDYVQSRCVNFNGREFKIYSDLQNDHDNHHCRNLDMKKALCMIYEERPFSCDFEILRFFHFAEGPNRISTQLFGRAWALTRIDGQKGAKCELLEPSETGRDEAVRKLRRLQQWCKYFKLKSKTAKLITILNNADMETFGGARID